jgi:hypothetical protein
MNWFIPTICGLFIILSLTMSIRYGSNHFRMRDFWAGLLTFFIGLTSLFFLPTYIAGIFWLLTSLCCLWPIKRAFARRNDKKVFEKPEISYVGKLGKQGDILPFSRNDDDDPSSPNAA